MKINNEVHWAGRVYRNEEAGDDPDGGAGAAADSGGVDDDSGGGDSGDGDVSAAADPDGGADADGDGGAPDDDWRRTIAGDDEAKYNRLQRYTDLQAWNESAFQAHDKLRAGEVSTGLPENPTEEQLTAYREANGIPVDGKYNIQLGEGLKLSDSDQEMLGGVLEKAYANNVPEAAVNEMLTSYYMARDKIIEDMEAQDNVDKQSFDKMSRENWGGDRAVNMNRITNQFNMLPENIRGEIENARLPNGQLLTNTMEFMNWVVGLDREINPMDPLPGGETTDLSTIERVIRESQQMMADEPDKWYKDADAQKRYQQAIEARDRYKKAG